MFAGDPCRDGRMQRWSLQTPPVWPEAHMKRQVAAKAWTHHGKTERQGQGTSVEASRARRLQQGRHGCDGEATALVSKKLRGGKGRSFLGWAACAHRTSTTRAFETISPGNNPKFRVPHSRVLARTNTGARLHKPLPYLHSGEEEHGLKIGCPARSPYN